ncbi:hypothetical protein [Agrococcus sp. Marseille-P2731]|uniref:hypothetical protein n=1 Tax=Agrococcus sp. Marseille-P2731 TaxID=1841862 RepID=UPI003FA47C64
MDRVSERRHAGIGRVLIAVYAVLAIAATGRSFVQIVQRFDEAPLAYSLSAAAAVVYIVATVALAMQRSRVARAVALAAVCFELVGVLVVGTLSIVAPSLFGHDSVWSYFGMGYVFIPAVLPFLGLWWLHASRERVAA